MTTTTENTVHGTAVSIRDCRLTLGRAGAETVEFHLPSLDIGAGERLALTGPSGCGKSTLLNLVSGLVRPSAGSVEVDGRDVVRLSGVAADQLRGQRMGFVYQSFNLLAAFNALDNVRVGLRFGRGLPRREWRARAEHLLERVGLAHRTHSKPAHLSVGERQRVAIARALANRPRLLLADEPTGALDPETAESVFALLLEICGEEGCTLMLVTHDLRLADRLPRGFDCRGLIHHRAAGSAAA